MFGSVSKPVKTTYTQNDVTSHGLSLSWKQQFLCRWTQCHLVSNTDVTGNIPASRSKHAICFYGDYIYMYGGQYGSTGYRDLWRYNIGHSGWEILRGTGELPSLLQSHTLVANEDKLYVFGGNFSADLETPLWIFHLGTLHWRKHAVRSEVMTPCSRRGHTAVLSHGAMHIYGGYVDLKGSNSELWTFDFVTDGWHLGYCAEDGKPGPSARHDHSAVVYGGAMWVFGGVMNLEAKSDLWCWNFDTHQWKRVKGHHGVPELCGHSACTVADSMLIFGGSTQGERQNALWRFHFGTSAWQRVRCEGVPPSPCDYHSIVVFQQRGSPPADRSHSAPHVGRNCSALLGPRTPQLRPNSSPAAMAAIHGTVPFQNKVEPCCENSTWSSSPERCEIEMCVAQRARTENPPLDATRVSCPLCSATGTLAMYQLRKSWSIDFCTRTGLRFRKVTDTQPLIRNGKYTNSSSENTSLSSFEGSMNPSYDNSPPYTSINQFQCRITDHENIPMKKFRQYNAAPLSARYDFHDNGASQFLASTRLCLGENRSHMGQSKLKNHFKSSSLESLLSRFDGAEIGGGDNQVTCRSVMKDDLIIEDIEETSFSCSDDVTNEIVMSSDKQSQEQGHFNCGATITNHVVACKVSDSSKSLIFVNNSATSDLHPVNVDTTGQLVRSDTNELRESDNETMCHSKMAWLLPSGDGSKENVAANTNYFEEKCEDEVIPDNEGVLVKMIAPSVTLSASGDTCHMSAVSDDRNPALWQMSTNGAVYHMFVFGGRVDEAQNHPVKPISISKLQISTMLM